MTDNRKRDNKKVETASAELQPMKNYAQVFKAHCIEQKQRISTGFLELDKLLSGGLANELYIMGAETSTGKSAFLMTIAQNVAASGIDVLYFALEMGRDEFVARAVSMISYEMHRKNPDENAPLISAAEVLYWKYDELMKDFTKMPYSKYEPYVNEYFKRYGDHLYILESGLGGYTVNNIADIAKSHKANHPDNQVVIFIDYMQIIKADPDDRSQMDRKTKTDVVTTTLKTLASQIGMPVITISSISRSNYNGKIGTSSFKESGDTEYTGGVLIGWNWQGVTNESNEDKRMAEKEKCRERGYRKMNLDILKYRNSERDVSVYFKYYPAYNYFEKDYRNISEDNNTQKDSKSKYSTGKGPVYID